MHVFGENVNGLRAETLLPYSYLDSSERVGVFRRGKGVPAEPC